MNKNKLILIATLFSLIIIGVSLCLPFDFKSIFSHLPQPIIKKLQILAQEGIYHLVLPHYPQRIIYLAQTIEAVSQSIAESSEQVQEAAQQCSCENVDSYCIPPAQQDIIKAIKEGLKEGEYGSQYFCQPAKTFAGNPCPQFYNLEGPLAIELKKEQLNLLLEILKKEMATDLARELEALPPDLAQQLETNLNDLVSSSEQLIGPAESIQASSGQCLASNCSSQCKTVWGWQACIKSPGQQSNSLGELIFNINVGLTPLSLGQVTINNIGLVLPPAINLPQLPTISAWQITFPDLYIDFPLPKLISYPVSPPPLPTLPPISFACPDFSSTGLSSSHSYGDTISVSPKGGNGWDYQVYTWLRTKCQEIVDDLVGPAAIPLVDDEDIQNAYKESYNKMFLGCFNPKNVVNIIKTACSCGLLRINTSDCDDYPAFNLSFYRPSLNATSTAFCASILPPTVYGTEEAKCNQLLIEQGEFASTTLNPTSSECLLQFVYPPTIPPTPTDASLNQILTTLKKKCQEIKKENPTTTNSDGNIIAAVPEPCEYLALFCDEPACYSAPTTTIRDSVQAGGGKTNSVTLGDFPLAMLACSAPPSIPTIQLPKIHIDDIDLLPTIDLCIPPIGGIKFKPPKITFEDLILPDINLCNLDNCGNFFPGFSFQLVSLNIPPIEVPGISLGEGLPWVELGKIVFPQLYFPMFNLFGLPNIMVPKLTIQPPQLPELTFYYSFQMNINYEAIAKLALKMFLKLLGINIPSFPSGCVGGQLVGECLYLEYNDIKISWPFLPHIPEIPFCQDINNYCLKMKKGLANVLYKVEDIQDKINQTIQNEIQARIDKGVETINQELTQKIISEFNGRVDQIRQQIQICLQKNTFPCLIHLDPISINAIDLNQVLNWPQSIPLPKELKNIKIPPITISLPTINLPSFQKNLTLKLPAFQDPFQLPSLSLTTNAPYCETTTFSGEETPCPGITDTLNQIKSINNQISTASQNIVKILQ